jgi:hypothetical protein
MHGIEGYKTCHQENDKTGRSERFLPEFLEKTLGKAMGVGKREAKVLGMVESKSENRNLSLEA